MLMKRLPSNGIAFPQQDIISTNFHKPMTQFLKVGKISSKSSKTPTSLPKLKENI